MTYKLSFAVLTMAALTSNAPVFAETGFNYVQEGSSGSLFETGSRNDRVVTQEIVKVGIETSAGMWGLETGVALNPGSVTKYVFEKTLREDFDGATVLDYIIFGSGRIKALVVINGGPVMINLIMEGRGHSTDRYSTK